MGFLLSRVRCVGRFAGEALAKGRMTRQDVDLAARPKNFHIPTVVDPDLGEWTVWYER